MKNLVQVSRKARALRYRLQPEVYWRSYARNARALGYDRLYAVFSFDCDTDEDIPAAMAIHRWLRERGQQAVFAVPGAQLRVGAATFRTMADEGAEFINHGGAAHAEKRGDRYWSVNFYDQMSPRDVEGDILSGHNTIIDALGLSPSGFRAPHFGHYQTKENLSHLYGILQQHGYSYASTTLPSAHRINAPHHSSAGLLEFPVSGHYLRPMQVFDSWSHLKSVQTPLVTDGYGWDMIYTIRRLQAVNVVGVLNYYCDPAHVAGSQAFFEALEYCLASGIPIITYRDIVSKFA